MRCDRGTAPHRPFKIIYATLYYDVIRPTFVVDITVNSRLGCIPARVQDSVQRSGSRESLFPAQGEVRARVESMARF